MDSFTCGFETRASPSNSLATDGSFRLIKIRKHSPCFAIPPPVTEFTVFYIFTIDNLGLLRYNKLVMYAHQIYYIIKYIIKTYKRRIHPC